MAGHDSSKMLISLLVPSLCYFSIFQRYRRYSAAFFFPVCNFSFCLNSVLPQGLLLNSYYTLDVVLNASAIEYNCHLLVKSCCEKHWHTYVQTVVKQQLKNRRQVSKIAVPAPTTWGCFKKQVNLIHAMLKCLAIKHEWTCLQSGAKDILFSTANLILQYDYVEVFIL